MFRVLGAARLSRGEVLQCLCRTPGNGAQRVRHIELEATSREELPKVNTRVLAALPIGCKGIRLKCLIISNSGGMQSCVASGHATGHRDARFVGASWNAIDHGVITGVELSGRNRNVGQTP